MYAKYERKPNCPLGMLTPFDCFASVGCSAAIFSACKGRTDAGSLALLALMRAPVKSGGRHCISDPYMHCTATHLSSM